MPRSITPSTSLDVLRKEARRWLRALKTGDRTARARIEAAWRTAPAAPVLRDVQHALALEFGLESWRALKQALESRDSTTSAASVLRPMSEYSQLASDMVVALDGDAAALARMRAMTGRAFTHDDLWAEIWRRVYAFRQRSSRVPKNYLQLEEAQMVVAQDVGFGSWAALGDAVANGTRPVPAHSVDAPARRLGLRRQLSVREWDEVIAVMKERQLTALDAAGTMTDEVLERVATLDHVTSLSLGGSRLLTDEGLQHLARMPQLEHLDLSEYPGGKLTDRGLRVLQHLPNLRTFDMTWQSGITDAGVAHLASCDRLERVNLMGSPTGNAAIAALRGKAALRHFSSGRLVTDDGLAMLHEFPRMRTWQGPHVTGEGDAANSGGAHLLIDGPFSNAGLASLAGLEGVLELDLFWHVTGVTTEGFAALAGLSNLGSLGADGALSDDEAMRHFASIPRLRRLRAQESKATDTGFEALSRSASLQFFWGRECPNFGSRGFIAFSKLPALRGLGIGCANVDDAALATLPDFPALRELTPIGFRDEAFRHVGRCGRLTRLTCMYCRDTTDVATASITNLPLTYYYAGLTQITDRSLELLGRIGTLEQVELYECQHVTDAGLPYLATLPRLREVAVDGVPGVTLAGTRVFPERVRVRYTT